MSKRIMYIVFSIILYLILLYSFSSLEFFLFSLYAITIITFLYLFVFREKTSTLKSYDFNISTDEFKNNLKAKKYNKEVDFISNNLSEIYTFKSHKNLHFYILLYNVNKEEYYNIYEEARKFLKYKYGNRNEYNEVYYTLVIFSEENNSFLSEYIYSKVIQEPFFKYNTKGNYYLNLLVILNEKRIYLSNFGDGPGIHYYNKLKKEIKDLLNKE